MGKNNFEGDSWTEEDDALLLKLAGNKTYLEIASILERTRDAIAGRLSRIRARNTGFKAIRKKKRPIIIPSETGSVLLINIKSNQCHWPCNGQIYCGEPNTKPHGYCEFHRQKSIRK